VSGGAIAGIAIGAVVAIALGALGAVLVLRRRRRTSPYGAGGWPQEMEAFTGGRGGRGGRGGAKVTGDWQGMQPQELHGEEGWQGAHELPGNYR
jgi:hypothetical protein